jgi:hypothetical protein
MENMANTLKAIIIERCIGRHATNTNQPKVYALIIQWVLTTADVIRYDPAKVIGKSLILKFNGEKAYL